MTDAPARHPDLLDAARSRLVVIDVQQKFLPTLPEPDRLVGVIDGVLEAAERLGVPATASEQYPQGLGGTVEPLAGRLPDRRVKTAFSAAPALGLGPCEGDVERDQIVLCGIETAICVCQTAMDLMADGYAVFVVADACSGRKPDDGERALRRLSDYGAAVVTADMVLFEWVRDASHEQFKSISAIVKRIAAAGG